MRNHTPGPWKVVRNRNSHWGMVDVEGPGIGKEPHLVIGFTVATDVDAARADRISADASLIAAAPDLLTALQEAESFLCIMFGRGPDAVVPDTVDLPIGVPCKLGDIVRGIKAAIAKAEGQ